MQPYNLDAVVNRHLQEALQLCRMGRFGEASAIYARVMVMAPNRIEPYLNCGEIALAESRYEDALNWFEKARTFRPDMPQALMGAGQALLALGRPDAALKVYERLQLIVPSSDMGPRGVGEALSQLGRLQEARTAFERAVALAPDVAGHHYALSQVARFVENDSRLPRLEALGRKISTLPLPAQADLHFALAKACDDLGRYDQAFAHWQAGNASKRQIVDYNEAMYHDILRDLAAAFPAETMAARAGLGDPSDVPVFVVGMPRSGTTLVEQIIASHPQAFGAGERMDMHYLLGQNILGENFPAHFSDVPNAALQRFGAQYLLRLRAHAPAAMRIVDKLPANFMLCGPIHLALPNARIIHVRRDPRDTCFSCYANQFSQGIDYSYDMGALGRYYRAYDGLMDHWRAVLPAGVMLEVQYEDLVADFESQAKRLIAFCGLDWHEDCLSFYKTKRVVHTLSAAQVRQPLYKTSIARWKPYAAHLGPLFAALGVTA